MYPHMKGRATAFQFPEFLYFVFIFRVLWGVGDCGSSAVSFYSSTPQVILIFLSTFFYFRSSLSEKALHNHPIRLGPPADNSTLYKKEEDGETHQTPTRQRAQGAALHWTPASSQNALKSKRIFLLFFFLAAAASTASSSQSSSSLSSIVAGVTNTYRRQTTDLNNNNNRERRTNTSGKGYINFSSVKTQTHHRCTSCVVNRLVINNWRWTPHQHTPIMQKLMDVCVKSFNAVVPYIP